MSNRAWFRIGVLTCIVVGAACGATEPREYVVHLQVGADSIACTGAHGPRKCLQVRELVGGDAWSAHGPLFDPIEGFAHEPGFIYDLSVARREIRNPPQDSGSLAYRLLSVLSKVPRATQ